MSRDGSVGVAAPMVQMRALAQTLESPGPTGARNNDAVAIPVPSFDEVYTAHVAFVWRVMRTLGVAEPQLEDAVQDVFIVVHRRLPEWEGRAAMTTWLFAIARRVASSHRRRVNHKTEVLEAEPAGAADPFADLSRARAAATVMAILDKMDEDKRIVFALVELEQLSVPEVARVLDLKLNTAYSRLRLARQAFEAAARDKVKP